MSYLSHAFFILGIQNIFHMHHISHALWIFCKCIFIHTSLRANTKFFYMLTHACMIACVWILAYACSFLCMCVCVCVCVLSCVQIFIFAGSCMNTIFRACTFLLLSSHLSSHIRLLIHTRLWCELHCAFTLYFKNVLDYFSHYVLCMH